MEKSILMYILFIVKTIIKSRLFIKGPNIYYTNMSILKEISLASIKKNKKSTNRALLTLSSALIRS